MFVEENVPNYKKSGHHCLIIKDGVFQELVEQPELVGYGFDV